MVAALYIAQRADGGQNRNKGQNLHGSEPIKRRATALDDVLRRQRVASLCEGDRQSGLRKLRGVASQAVGQICADQVDNATVTRACIVM